MRFSFVAATAAIAAPAVYGQGGSEDGPNNSTVPTADDGNRTIHYVDVAKGGHYYIPNSIQAEVGDLVTFRFYPSNHSVIRAAYEFPCIPYEDVVPDGEGFDSGFFETQEISANPETWNLTVTTTEPVFYYCGAPGSCLDWGMVGVINANASQDITRQIDLATKADYMLLPGEPFPDEAISSASSFANAAPTATVTEGQSSNAAAQASATGAGAAAGSHSSSGLSGGAIAGIVVGAVAGLAILAGVFFLLGRTKSMKKRMDERENQDRQDRHQSQQMSMGGTPSWMPPQQGQNMPYFNPNNPHASAQLPPYGHPDHSFYEQKPPDETASLASGPMTPPLRGQSPPPMQGYEQHPMPGFQSLDQRSSANYGYNNHNSMSELSGSTPMAAEMYTPGKDGTSNEGHPAYK